MDKPPVEEEELYLSWALLILTSLLILSLFSSYYLQHKQIRIVHETVLSIFAGMIVGFAIRVSPGILIQKMVTFDYTYFFNLLLPPILLNSGYEMKQENFFRSFGTILTFALVGTFISALVIGGLIGMFSAIGMTSLSLSFLDSMIFGSVLSATDPVTVLTIFQVLKVDPKLYNIIFGESILNDAVAIVLYETLKKYRGKDFHLANITHGISSFLLNFGTSIAMGILIGILCALMLKHSRLYKYPSIESCLVSLLAYSSYFLSNGLNISGIVSLLFCGITLKHYAYDSMSLQTKRTTRYMFHVLAKLSENFIFIYLGLTLFTQLDLEYKPVFITITMIIICISRYSAVFPLSNLINAVSRYRNKSETIPYKYSAMLFWAGLRGAVAFALAAGLEGENANAMRTTILVVVVLSVIIFGGTTNLMLEIMKIQTGVEEGGNDSDEDDYNDYFDEYNNGIHYGERYRDNDRDGDDGGHNRTGPQGLFEYNSRDTSNISSLQQAGISTSVNNKPNNKPKKHWFISFDDKYLKPLFMRNDRDFRRLNRLSRNRRNRENRVEGRYAGNEDDFARLIRNSSSRTDSRNNNSASYRGGGGNFNNRQKTEFTNNTNILDLSENTSSPVQRDPDLNILLIDDNQNDKNESNDTEHLLDLNEFPSNN